jgi:hypothetical protein
MTRTLLLALTATLPALARADRCAELAKPRTFDAASAMRAIFCEYDAEHEGTLIPVKRTRRWQIADASELVTPLVVRTFVEGGVTKGLLAAERRVVENGKPDDWPEREASISVYVFRKDGEVFAFERGKREVTQGGTFGRTTGVEFARLGQDRYGLWVSASSMFQGSVYGASWVVSLSDDGFPTLITQQTNVDERCPDEPAEEDAPPCRSWTASMEMLAAPGEHWDLLRVSFTGTPAKGGTICYLHEDGKYVDAEMPDCAARAARPHDEVFPDAR